MRRLMGGVAAGALMAGLAAGGAWADAPPALTTGPVVTGPGGQPIQSQLLGSERGLAIPFASVADLTPAYAPLDPLDAAIIRVTQRGDTIGPGQPPPAGPARYAAATGTAIVASNTTTSVTQSFAFSVNETQVTHVTNVGGGVTARVRIAGGGPVLASATATTAAAAQSQALAGASLSGVRGRILPPIVSTAGVVEGVSETRSSVLAARDTYMITLVTFGPNQIVTGNLGACNHPLGTCQGGVAVNFDAGSTNFDFHVFQDLYITTTVERTITASGLVTLDIPVAAPGFAHASAQTVGFDLSDRFLSGMLPPGGPGEGGEGGTWMFLEGVGGRGSVGDASSYDFSGVRGGIGWRPRDGLAVGVVVEGGRASWGMADPLFTEASRSSGLQAGAFAQWAPGRWRLGLAGFAGGQDLKTTDTSLAGAGVSHGKVRATVYGFGASAGYPLSVGGFTVTPRVGVSWLGWHTPGYAETGGLAPLTLDAATRSQVRPEAGLGVERAFALGERTRLTLGVTGRLFGITGDKSGEVTARDGVSPSAFAITDPGQGSSGREAGVSAALTVGGGVALYAGYEGRWLQHGGDDSSWRVGARVAF